VADAPGIEDLEQERNWFRSSKDATRFFSNNRGPRSSDHEAGTLAYRMAALLPMELESRQALLEMRSQHARREAVLRWMEKFLPRLVALERARERAAAMVTP